MSRLPALLSRLALAASVPLLLWLLLELALLATPLGDGNHRRIQLERSWNLATTYSAPWGWSFTVGEFDLDYTGREKQPVLVHFSTMPMPGRTDIGVRDEGITTGKPLVPVLGDSFTFGATVQGPEIWCEQLELLPAGRGYDWFNIATGGGATKAAMQFELMGASLPEHQTVVYAMWLGNEFADNEVFEAALAEAASFAAGHDRARTRLRWAPMTEGLAIAYTAGKAVSALLKGKGAAYGLVREELWHDRIGALIPQPAEPILLRTLRPGADDAALQRGFAATETALKRLRDAVAPAKLVVLVLPFKEQVHDDVVRDLVPGLDFEQPNRAVAAMCARLGLRCVDVLTELRQHRDEKLYWDYDPHWTPLGHRRAAEAIGRLL